MERRLIDRGWRGAVAGLAVAGLLAGCAVADPTEPLGEQLKDTFEDDRLQDLSGG